ncbi:chaplin [Streptomyces nitrosporeus]|uniref:chaplin n=1 Tax=Streptomyces nitrosporeus TaxID=28894 RepID=UPI00399F5B77
MRQVTRKGLITMAAAGGVLALGGGYAHADAGAAGGASNSPGVLSGNSIQVPVHVPVNVCGNSVDVVGALNPASGNGCGNGPAYAAHAQSPDSAPAGGHGAGGRETGDRGTGSHTSEGHGPDAYGSGDQASAYDETRGSGAGTGRHRASGASAEGEATGSPGILSGNQVQVPIEVPVNLCGNSITIGGLLNPVFGNDCENGTGPATPEVPQTPGTPHEPVKPSEPSEPKAPETQFLSDEQLAQTGAGGAGLLIPAGAGALLAGAGAVLYRRSRAAA